MCKVSLASLQTFIDMPICVLRDRVQYSMVHIPKVFSDGHLWPCFLYRNHQVHGDFLITLYFSQLSYPNCLYWYLKVGQNHFHPHSLQFVIH
jgi:hypothetical protein